MSDEEIIPRPPSHPIATGLLIASVFGVMANIALVINELNTYYLPKGPFKPRFAAEKNVNDPIKVIEKYGSTGKRNGYYEEDFGTRKVEDDIKASDGSGGSGSGGGADGS
jgi:hypothetical protein